MKKVFTLLLVVSLTTCSKKELSLPDIVTRYYEAFNASDFLQLTPLLADSITIAEGDYITSYSIDSFHEQFKWDSVFQPTYEITELKELNSQVVATVASSSRRYEFLKNNPLTCEFRFSFNSNKIASIEVMECSSADWELWQEERDSLVAWASINHPELNGFIHDLTMKGAINYLKAIELYEKREN